MWKWNASDASAMKSSPHTVQLSTLENACAKCEENRISSYGENQPAKLLIYILCNFLLLL